MPIQFDLVTKIDTVTCGEGRISRGKACPHPEEQGHSVAEIFGTRYLCPYGLT